MLSELRNRLQAGKRTSTRQVEPRPTAEPIDGGMAWELPAAESLYETRSQLNPTDAEWRERIYQQLLKVMDLSLIDALEPSDALWQIREICQRLLYEHAAPVFTQLHIVGIVSLVAQHLGWDKPRRLDRARELAR